jgi:hypothetical protein
MITTQAEPCWHLADQHGETFDSGDGAPHFDSEDKAQASAEFWSRQGDASLTPKRYEQPCVVVECNGCGGPLDDGVWKSVHFDSEAEARDGASWFDWETDLGPNLWCPECPRPVAAGADPDRLRGDDSAPVAAASETDKARQDRNDE